jgi:hypothetical protein
VTAFFIPGVAGDSNVLERAYGDMRSRVEEDMGRRPTERRIMRLWARRGKVDCVTEVGMPDPLRGGTVIAIFDMGQHQPYVVWWQPGIATHDGVRDVLAPNVYSVSEFDP